MLEEVLERHAGDRDGLIPVLQGAQGIYGYLPEEVIEAIGVARGVALADVYGVATFYAELRLEPRGRRTVKVCHGTACHVSGARQLTEAVSDELGIPEGGTTEDGEFTLESVSCLGCCGLAPVMLIGEQAYGRLTPDTAREAARNAGKGRKR